MLSADCLLFGLFIDGSNELDIGILYEALVGSGQLEV